MAPRPPLVRGLVKRGNNWPPSRYRVSRSLTEFRHIGLDSGGAFGDVPDDVAFLAAAFGLDPRALESALVNWSSVPSSERFSVTLAPSTAAWCGSTTVPVTTTPAFCALRTDVKKILSGKSQMSGRIIKPNYIPLI